MPVITPPVLISGPATPVAVEIGVTPLSPRV